MLEELVSAADMIRYVGFPGAVTFGAVYGGASLARGFGQATTVAEQIRNPENLFAGLAIGGLTSLGAYAQLTSVGDALRFAGCSLACASAGLGLGAVGYTVVDAARSHQTLGQSFASNAGYGAWRGALGGAGLYWLYSAAMALNSLVRI